MAEHGVRFRPGMVVSPGEYRNVETGAVRYFDGSSPIPGGVNSAAWEQISDHHHPNTGRGKPASRTNPDRPSSTGVRFTAGTIVSAGEYRNTETGAVRWFDGNTPLPGGANAASWQQISDHFHPSARE